MKLKACPFCGGEGRLFTGVSSNKSYAKVYCGKCRVGTKDVFDQLNDGSFIVTVVELWNRRVGDSDERFNQQTGGD